MSRGVRFSAASAAATVAVIAAAGHAIGHLAASEEEIRNPTVEAVHFIAPLAQEVVPSHDLLASVRGIDPVACRLVGQALQNRWGRGAVAPSWSLPGDGGVEVTQAVTSALRGEVPVAEAPALLTALASSQDCERRIAAQLLGRIDDSPLINRLSEMMGTGAARARIGAALALGFGEWPEGIDALVGGLGSQDADLRATAAWALGRTEHVDAIDPLSAALRDPAVEVRANAVVALGWIESTRSVAPLTDALRDDTPQIRANAAWALGEIESPEAIPALTTVLGEDGDPQVRRAAAWALGRIE